MLKVKDIIDFFNTPIEDGIAKSLFDLLHTIPEFSRRNEENGREELDISMITEYHHICQKMCDDLFLTNVNPTELISAYKKYIYSLPADIFSNPDSLRNQLEYGYYDFKYRGQVYTRDYFADSVLPIDAIRNDGDFDIGTAFYIGEKRFVTAAHCVKDCEKFRLLRQNGEPILLKEIWFADGFDTNVYDLAVIVVDDDIEFNAFELAEPSILDEVLVMGYPPVSGFNAIQTSETATVGAYQKSSTGQVIGSDTPYLIPLDFFLINARVKGGSSGGPVINNTGYVIGAVVKLPFDVQSDSNNPRYDLMGYGMCLPSKYIKQLIHNPIIKTLSQEGGYYRL